MPARTKQDIKEFWSKASQTPKDKDGLSPTARDPYLQLAVEKIILEELRPGARLLDVGCGDGSSTVKFARAVGYALGVDYIDEFVRKARDKAVGEGLDNVDFVCGDVTRLSESVPGKDPFDVAVSIRCLINLPEWPMQALGVREIARQVRPGGTYLCSEGWAEGLDGLNRARTDMGLDPIAASHYNRLMTRSEFEQAVSEEFDIVGYHGLGLYMLLSRVLHPCLSRPEAPSHTDKLNRIACELQNTLALSDRFDDIDYAGVYVMRKR